MNVSREHPPNAPRHGREAVARASAGASLWLVAGCLLGSCIDKPPSSVVVALTSEAPIPDSIDEIKITVHVGDTIKFERTYAVPLGASLPGTLVLEREEDSQQVSVMVKAMSHGIERSSRRATLAFVEGKQKLLRMPVQFACFDTNCPAGQTCRAGACAEPSVEANALPDFVPEQIFPTPGSCFDHASCIDKTERETTIDEFFAKDKADPTYFDREKCTISSEGAPPGEGFNMGFFWSQHPTQDWTMVDFDPQEGWQFAEDGRIKLAPGLCAELKKPVPRITKLLTAVGCPPKPPTVPECPENEAEEPKL